MNSIWKIIANFSELVVFKHSVFAFPFIFIAMIVSANGWFGWSVLLLSIITAVTARNFAMAINRYLDRDIDRLNSRTKNRPSVDGRISDMYMVSFIIANAIVFIAAAYMINSLAFRLSIPILAILGIYTLCKRFSSIAHLVLGVSLGLAPIAGTVAVLNDITTWSVYLATGVMFWVAGFDVLYSLQDIEFDKKHGLHSIPSRFGIANTMRIAQVFHFITILFWSLFIYTANLGIWAWMAVILAAIMLSYEHYIVNKDFSKIDRAFFTINGYLGFVFFVLIVIDIAF